MPPFAAFATSLKPQTPLRAAITAATRRPEENCLPPLIDLAAATPDEAARTEALARKLVEGLRARGASGGVEVLMQEYALSSQEGVALMCLAEALLRTPDVKTRDALIRDKISSGDWRAHLGHSPSLFVNAATWGLVVTGRLTATTAETGLASALSRLIGRSGEPVIRAGVDMAMRLLGEQFVAGRTIEEALDTAREREERGFSHSYDMLGEAAATAEDAARYLASYSNAIRRIGATVAGRDVHAAPGVSIKLSALHPRYARQKRERVMAQLLPRVKGLAAQARELGVGVNIDAEEADRLELSLDLLEALAFDPALGGWNGLGFVVQAYGRRCPFVVDWLADLARRSDRRLMLRLVKGAYWDSEIKRAQADGLDGFPVFTRKVHTDVSYLACARKMLAAREDLFPQFATHNAQTLAAIMTMAGPGFAPGDYEFQCLHGMGEPLYEQVVGESGLNRPCRIYAPVGSHETLLAYLVRRLLENGANTSFVNRVADDDLDVEALIADPVEEARRLSPPGAPHEKIRAPRELFPGRANARGLDFSDETGLSRLAEACVASTYREWIAAPTGTAGEAPAPVTNPADRCDVVGSVSWTRTQDVAALVARAASGATGWAALPAADRATILRRAADAMEDGRDILAGLIIREAGKTFSAAIAEVREAVDFLRFYAAEAERLGAAGAGDPLGVVAAISPWNFPLAIFCGQVCAALAAGNAVVAKPAEETPLIAAEAVRLLRAAGVPEDALLLAPGAGEVGAALVGDPDIQGVLFTGSTEAAKSIQRTLAKRLDREGGPVTLIAETGGQNAMIVDSSALAEQVVADVIASAFDSAGQRCSALRILCLQEDVAERVTDMLKGATAELEVGPPDRLSTDVGPVIAEEARATIERHVAAMRAKGFGVHRTALPESCAGGSFVAPTIIEIGEVADVGREVFGPVLHVLRYRADDLDGLVDAINATGYGLTFGLHTRIDETILRVIGRVRAGNSYVNRNIVGAVVGSQPFGGSGLSGTGPKAGGPLYLARLMRRPGEAASPKGDGEAPEPARAFARWLAAQGFAREAELAIGLADRSPLGASVELPGPVGERNLYELRGRGRVAAIPASAERAMAHVAAILAAGGVAVVERDAPGSDRLAALPEPISAHVELVEDLRQAPMIAAYLFDGGEDRLLALQAHVAERFSAVVPVISAPTGRGAFCGSSALARLVEEYVVSTNTAAAGGNASLMTIG